MGVWATCFTFSPSYLGSSSSCCLCFCWVVGAVVLSSTQGFCILGLHLSQDHRRLDDRQSLGARTAAAQKNN